MSIVAEFHIRSPELSLTETFGAMPGAEFDLVTEVATDPDRPVLFFWAEASDFEAFEAAMTADHTVGEWSCYTQAEGRHLYRIQLTEQTGIVLYPMWVELGVDLLRVRHADGWWRFRARFPDRNALSTMRDRLVEQGVEFTLQSVLDSVVADDVRSPLTGAQTETLRLALEHGFFEVPREATLADLAEELGVSAQSVSERLRRGTAALAADHFEDATAE